VDGHKKHIYRKVHGLRNRCYKRMFENLEEKTILASREGYFSEFDRDARRLLGKRRGVTKKTLLEKVLKESENGLGTEEKAFLLE